MVTIHNWCLLWALKISVLLCYLYFPIIYFGFIKAGNECCKTGQIYSGRNECHMIPNINNVGSDRVSCLLQTTYCCLESMQKNFCQKIGLDFIHNRHIQDYLRSIVEQRPQKQGEHGNNVQSIYINASQFWPMLQSRYQCHLRDNSETFCCVGCTLGFASAIKKILEWDRKKITEMLINLNIEEWCSGSNSSDVRQYEHRNAAFDVCCQEMIKTINSSIRWCDLRPAPCAHNCHEARIGSNKIQCSCWEGYRLAPDGKNCIDVDECQELTHDCNDVYEICSNIEGGYQCLSKIDEALPRIPGLGTIGNRNECSKGFYYNFTQDRCKDIDECAQSKHDCNLSYQVCVNKLGSYQCIQVGLECPKGFRRMAASTDFDTGCRDIDECREGLYNCDYLREDCENFIGSFSCEEKPNVTRTTTTRTIWSDDSIPAIPELFNIKNETEIQNTQQTTSCPKGYHFVRFSFQCEDINECRIGQHNCDLSRENCINFPGSYSCRLNKINYDDYNDDKYDQDKINVIIDHETDNDKNKSEKNDKNLSFGGHVVCRDGFSRNPALNICEDIDECKRTNGPCSRNSLCQNTIGSYVCHCKSGYTKNYQTGECEDLNECEKKLNNCPETMRCVNTLGSFECVPQTSVTNSALLSGQKQRHCPNKKIFDPIKKECVNNVGRQPDATLISIEDNSENKSNKCQFGERMIQGECKTVVCGQGFFYNETDKRCQDMNECLEYSPCRPYEKCTNTIGSYRCSRKCNAGYRVSANGQSCEDIDECSNGMFVCPTNKICTNRRGSYSCECLKGYVALYNGSCQDINECEQGDKLLCDDPETQSCVNTIGSYKCQCKNGYQQLIDDDGSNVKCIDVDECKNKTNSKCQHYCHNYVGSYKCSCHSGYKLDNDGFTCVDEDECQMFQSPDQIIGIDSDVSKNGERSSLCYYKCVNVPGSFRCICPNGYESLREGSICQDIDECEQENICNDNEFCLNVRGSHRCIALTCPEGYFFEMKTKKCLRHHEGVIGFRDLSKPISYSFNYLSIVSNIRIPKSLDYFDLVSMNGKVFAIPGIKYNLTLNQAKPGKYGVKLAMRENFILRRPKIDEIVVSLIKPLQGPQDVDLELTISIYPEDKFGGMSKAFIYIVVSEYEF